jgi:hypothetical protein
MAASASSSASVSFTYSMVASSLKVTSGGSPSGGLREPVLPLGDADHEVRLLPLEPEPVHQGQSDRLAMTELHGLSAGRSAYGLLYHVAQALTRISVRRGAMTGPRVYDLGTFSAARVVTDGLFEGEEASYTRWVRR